MSMGAEAQLRYPVGKNALEIVVFQEDVWRLFRGKLH